MKFLVNVDLAQNQLLNAKAQVLASDPVTPQPGRIWYNSTDETLNFAINDNSVIALAASSTDALTLQGENGAYYRARANHTGTQTTASISDFTTATQTLIDAATDALVDSAPGTLDTLNELAAALGDDPNFATTVTNLLNAKPDKFASTIGDGVATAIVVNHALNSTDVLVQVKEVATSDLVYADVDVTDANNVTVTFAVAPASNAYRVTVVG